MAVTYSQNLIVMTAANDTEGRDNSGIYDHPLFIRYINVDTGDGGDVLIDDSNGGSRVLKLDNTPANDTLEQRIDHFVKGIFVTTLPTNATIEIHLGRPGQ